MLGRGAGGSVYLARWSEGRLVAVKQMHLDTSDRVASARFHQEADTMASLKHPGLVVLHELRDDPDDCLLIMEYVEGPTLRQLLPAIDPATGVEVIQQLAAALDAAHAGGVVHRDLKPANVLVTAAGVCKLVDFGVARFLGDSRHASSRNLVRTGTGAFVGTPEYLSPEIASGSTGIDHRADVYSLGVLAYRLLVGRLPFTGRTYEVLRAQIAQPPPKPTAVLPEFPFGVEEVLLRALLKAPDDRYRSAGELAAALTSSAANARWTDGADIARGRLAALASRTASNPIVLRDLGADETPTIDAPSPAHPRVVDVLPPALTPVFQPKRAHGQFKLIMVVAAGLLLGAMLALAVLR